jgi:hypothetical protein
MVASFPFQFIFPESGEAGSVFSGEKRFNGKMRIKLMFLEPNRVKSV